MHQVSKFLVRTTIASLLLLWLGIDTVAGPQGRMTIQATAMGTSTYMGKIVNVNIYVEQFDAGRSQFADRRL